MLRIMTPPRLHNMANFQGVIKTINLTLNASLCLFCFLFISPESVKLSKNTSWMPIGCIVAVLLGRETQDQQRSYFNEPAP